MRHHRRIRKQGCRAHMQPLRHTLNSTQ